MIDFVVLESNIDRFCCFRVVRKKLKKVKKKLKKSYRQTTLGRVGQQRVDQQMTDMGNRWGRSRSQKGSKCTRAGPSTSKHGGGPPKKSHFRTKNNSTVQTTFVSLIGPGGFNFFSTILNAALGNFFSTICGFEEKPLT